MFVGAVALLGWAMFYPCRVGESIRAPQRHPRKSIDEARAHSAPTKASFAEVLNREYQAPLYDPPPLPTITVQEKKVAPPPVTLLGTFLESGGNQAMFTDSSGAMQICKIGESVEGAGTFAEIVTIEPGRVVLRHEGQLITLETQP
jgi:hypothetical protein